MANSLPYDFSVDTWSLGILTFEMVTGYSPFVGCESEIMDKIKSYQNLNQISEKLIENKASGNLFDFLEKILTRDINKRLSIEEVVQHPWIISNSSI
jgi:serine/threonine protein kinase